MFFSFCCTPFVALGACIVGVLAVPAVSEATHDLSAIYGLTPSGAGDYSFKPSKLSIDADIGDTPKNFYVANVENIANIRSRAPLVPRVPKFESCSTKRKQDLLRALASYRMYISRAIVEVFGSPRTTYERWFGTYDHYRPPIVERRLRNLKRNDIADLTFACYCINTQTFAWVQEHHMILHLCPDFWDLSPDGEDASMAMVLVFAAALRIENFPLRILAAGMAASQNLALRSPTDAIRNIDSYFGFIAESSQLAESDFEVAAPIVGIGP